MKLSVGPIAAAAMLAFLSAAGAACAEHQVAGKAAKDVFTDPGLAALADAACRGDGDAVATLVKAGTNSNGTGFQGATPLYWAITCENLVGMRALLKAGANPNQLNGGRYSAVYQASTYRNPALLKLLLEFHGDPDAYSRRSDETALMNALSLGIDTGNWENWDSLLKAGADVNKSNEVYYTVAVKAVTLSRFDKVVELLDLGYKCDLPSLGSFIELREGVTGPTPATLAVKEALKKRGVTFPIELHPASPADKSSCRPY